VVILLQIFVLHSTNCFLFLIQILDPPLSKGYNHEGIYHDCGCELSFSMRVNSFNYLNMLLGTWGNLSYVD